jgi:putative GTP pyrophosphokinase
MTTLLADAYADRHRRVLSVIAPELQAYLARCLHSRPRIDRISVRPKDPASFLRKAGKVVKETGEPKYTDPLLQIQDQIGARVVVYYKADVEPTSEVVKGYLRRIEERSLVPEHQWAFGYFGMHYILALPPDVVPAGFEKSDVPPFFELQVKTLFQHAWAEAEHDLGYKSGKELTAEQNRSLAYTAAQAWGADRVFQELHAELSM